VLAQFDRWAVRAEPLDELGEVEHALVLTPAANGDERHFGFHELAQRPAI